MGQKLPPFEMELYRLVDEVLYYRWDPIGIGDGVWARDEYYAYLPQTFSLLTEPEGCPKDIANYLHDIATNHIGMEGRAMERDMKIAEDLFAIKNQLKEKYDLR